MGLLLHTRLISLNLIFHPVLSFPWIYEFLSVLKVKKTSAGSRAFFLSDPDPLGWNNPPADIRLSESNPNLKLIFTL